MLNEELSILASCFLKSDEQEFRLREVDGKKYIDNLST